MRHLFRVRRPRTVSEKLRPSVDLDEAKELGTKIGALIGRGIEGEDGMEAGAASSRCAPRRPELASGRRGEPPSPGHAPRPGPVS